MSIRLSSTFFAKTQDVERKWLLIDGRNQVLGRLAAQIAKLLRGKHKPYYTPHINCGDNIIVINADKVKLTGKKPQQKIYYKHTGYPGGIKEIKAVDLLSGKYPQRMLTLAVKRMLPKESPLARQQLKDLHVYSGNEHPHEAQKPTLVNIVK
jgi:large subunit ribosomal protein L13